MLLEFRDVISGYASAPILRGLSGSVTPGEVLCVIGRNGVGKSTLMKVLFGYLRCWQGSISLSGKSIESLEPPLRHDLGIAYCPQERPVFDTLTVQDNLMLSQDGTDLHAFDSFFERFPVLSRRLRQLAGTLSGGEKKLLSLVRGLGEAKPLTLLDEPTEGVQWENILHMQRFIEQRKADGAAFIVVEQNLAFAERIADRYVVMDQGRIVLTGPRAQIDRAQLLEHLQV